MLRSKEYLLNFLFYSFKLISFVLSYLLKFYFYPLAISNTYITYHYMLFRYTFQIIIYPFIAFQILFLISSLGIDTISV
ncbi:hypothetical protein EHW71_12820 [Clostridium butyricum]|nr:hypothetical protein EHW71_12820 [Clostridium butyricum]